MFWVAEDFPDASTIREDEFFEGITLTTSGSGGVFRLFSQPAYRVSDEVKDDCVLEFRGEAFNLANHAQFFGASAVEGNISSGSFGQAVSAMSPRQLQLALRYRF